MSYNPLETSSTPSSWNKVLLHEVCTFISRGKQPKYVENSAIYALNQKSIRWGEIQTENLKFQNPNINISEEFFIQKKDIVLNSTGTGTVGRAFYFDKQPTLKMFADSHVTVIRTDEQILRSAFLYYQFSDQRFQNYINEGLLAGSTGQVELNKSKIRGMEILLPNIIIQDKIVAILLPLDKKIMINNQIIKTLKEIAATLFNHWFVDFEFPDENGNPYKSSGGKMVESELGDIPNQWNVGVISDLGQVVGGGTPSKKKEEYYKDGKIPWITPKDLSNQKKIFVLNGNTDITELGLSKSSAKLMPEGTILFSSRAPIGYIAIANNELATNQGFRSIIPNGNILTEFLYLFLKKNVKKIESMASGSTFKEVSGTVMKNINLIIPNEKVLIRFKEIVNPLFRKIEQLENETDILEETRDTLLPKLLSGEIELE